MKKILTLIVVMIMSISISAGAYVRNLPNIDQGTVIREMGNGNLTALEIPSDTVIGQTVDVGNYQVRSVEVRCPSFSNSLGNLTLSVYAWTGDYNSTVAQKPVSKQTFENFADNSRLKVVLPENADLCGKILITLSESSERVGVWVFDNPGGADRVMYVDGTAQENAVMQAVANTSKTVTEIMPTVAERRDAFAKTELGRYDRAKNIKSTLHVDYEGVGYRGFTADEGSTTTYCNMDFGSTGPKGVNLLVRNTGVNGDSAQLQLVLDDPGTGKVIAEFNVEYSQIDHFEMLIPCEITEKITGIHDVHLVCIGVGYAPVYMEFLKEKPGKSWDKIRLDEFNATKDFQLHDMYPDTWTATDMLGRKVADYAEAGQFNPDKQIGMFYWTWHAHNDRALTASLRSNNQQVIDTYPGDPAEIINDYHYPKWGTTGYWNESVYGYYHGLDKWVMRKQMELLSAAGIDGLFFDTTNGSKSYLGGAMALCDVLHSMHLDGIKTPGISFIFPFSDGTNTVANLERVYEQMYSIGLYSDCWYYFDGKPVLMSHYEELEKKTGYEDVDKQHREIREFFTFRPGQPDYRKGPSREDHWPWLEVYPQHAYGKSEKYGCECVSVGIAQNTNDNGLNAMNGKNIYGRSYTYKDRYSKLSETSKYYGYNFQEQWDRAFELDPEFVFVTGWNEWTAGHYEEWGVDKTKGAYPDSFADEYSRDIEPTKGDFKDSYYYLLVDNVRKFKGVRPAPETSGEKTIDLKGDFSQWFGVVPEFMGYKGGTEKRDHRAIGTDGINWYNNTTGRNDIVLSKVARDKDNLYFYVETAEDLTSYTDKNWMRLFINSDRTYKTGWEGYDFALNIEPASAEKLVLSKTETGWNWEKVAEVDYTTDGNKMMVAIPRSLLGIGDTVDIEFKWNDNMQEQGEIMDFYTNGDTAPIGRFNYHYVENPAKAKKLEDEPVEPRKSDKDLVKYSIIMKIGESKAFVRSNKTEIDENNPQVTPVIVKDKTMVPLRFLSESLGAKVTWEEATQTAKIVLNNKRIFITIGSDIMQIEKQKKTLQSPAFEQDGRIYIPLRDVVEMSGETCIWLEPDIIVLGGKPEEILSRETLAKTITKMFGI